LQGVQPGTYNRHLLLISDALDPALDTDTDGLPDAWEIRFFGHLNHNGASDPDNDGVSNLKEYKQKRNPDAPARPDTQKILKLKITTPVK